MSVERIFSETYLKGLTWIKLLNLKAGYECQRLLPPPEIQEEIARRIGEINGKTR